jgi:hypothetical protein
VPRHVAIEVADAVPDDGAALTLARLFSEGFGAVGIVGVCCGLGFGLGFFFGGSGSSSFFGSFSSGFSFGSSCSGCGFAGASRTASALSFSTSSGLSF